MSESIIETKKKEMKKREERRKKARKRGARSVTKGVACCTPSCLFDKKP